MRRAKKIALLAGCALVVVGFLLALSALIVLRFDFSKLNTMDYHTATYPVQESFSAIRVDVTDCDVQLLPAQDGACRVECPEGPGTTYSVSVDQGILTVTQHDEGAWYNHVGIYLGPVELTIYLPMDQYERLSVNALSGSITVPDNFSFDDIQVYTTSGSVSLSAQVAGEASVETVSGNQQLTLFQPQALRLQSTSGQIQVSQVVVGGSCHIDSVSGDVKLTDCDADDLHIQTTSGNVSAALRSPKVFSTHTTSGSVRIPQGTAGGVCEITTVSGDITCSVQ